MGKKILVLYLISIISIAIILGAFLDILVGAIGIKEMLSPGSRLPYVLQMVSAILLISIIFLNFLKKKNKEVEMEYSFYVPNMTCKHCQMTIEQALKKLSSVQRVEISVDKKLVKVDGEIDENKIVKQIKDAGYGVERNQPLADKRR